MEGGIETPRRQPPRAPWTRLREHRPHRDGSALQQGCEGEPPYPDYLQVDHKKLRALGGRDEVDDLTLLCDPYNRLESNNLTLTDLRQAHVSEPRMNDEWRGKKSIHGMNDYHSCGLFRS